MNNLYRPIRRILELYYSYLEGVECIFTPFEDCINMEFYYNHPENNNLEVVNYISITKENIVHYSEYSGDNDKRPVSIPFQMAIDINNLINNKL